MNYLSALLCLSVIAVAAADFGYYVPRAFYTINENGEKSPLVYINSIPEAFHRARRSPQLPGFPFGQPNFGAPLFPNLPGSQSTFSGVSTSTVVQGGGLASRFGEDEPVKTSQTTQVIHGQNGVYHATQTHQGPDGQVHYSQSSGRV